MTAKIAETTKTVWPEVQHALAQVSYRIADLAGVADTAVDKIEAYRAKNPNAPQRRRDIVEQTVWHLARLGYLRTGQERELVKAAKQWDQITESTVATEDDYERADDDLVAAIKALTDYDFTQED